MMWPLECMKAFDLASPLLYVGFGGMTDVTYTMRNLNYYVDGNAIHACTIMHWKKDASFPVLVVGTRTLFRKFFVNNRCNFYDKNNRLEKSKLRNYDV